jgi:hypothetical protein
MQLKKVLNKNKTNKIVFILFCVRYFVLFCVRYFILFCFACVILFCFACVHFY